MSAADSPLARFYGHHHGWLLQRLRGRVADRRDAEDLAAEAFCQVLVSRIDPAAIREPRAYLTTIASRLLFHLRRRRDLESAWLDRMRALPDAFAPSAEEQVALLEAIAAIDRLLAGLPQGAREAFLLLQLDGLDQAAIAARLGVSSRTVRRYLRDALRRCWLAGAGLA
ncbi:sigma-70 family RNA polymerase sigma factor [Luteimonas sp. XNQY3]|nr:sigma-70 family RNA polymerase sigma factor [Luteimonas sp. XNQY3]MCD9006774.1 sigma-70 family RNA polymerase sigma factor [Luteimonas sp. XNQY3]